MVGSQLAKLLKIQEAEVLQDWLAEQLSAEMRTDLIRESELREESREFLNLFSQAIQHQNLTSIHAPEWSSVKEMLASISRSRAQKGFSPSETATFVLSLKQPLFNRLRNAYRDHPQALVDDIWHVTTLLDQLGLWTTEVYQKSREEVILRQQQELVELSTPVVKLWDGILALPIIGTLDSNRTQVVMESLLQKIVETGSEVAIIDITGVPTVDTLTAQHLLKTVSAARLMGADCIISGIRPQIAQTIVYLGIDLSDVKTKSSLADAFLLAMKQRGMGVTHLSKMKE
jgi:rsbT co-antagonist protein RsbR